MFGAGLPVVLQNKIRLEPSVRVWVLLAVVILGETTKKENQKLQLTLVGTIYFVSLTALICHREEFLNLTFQALALHPMIRVKGLTLETSALETLCRCQFTLSTHLIKPNYLMILF